MYHHVKKLMYTVNIGQPDVRFGNMLLEQFGGQNGELAAAMQYSSTPFKAGTASMISVGATYFSISAQKS
jgi:Mn-containing catalase